MERKKNDVQGSKVTWENERERSEKAKEVRVKEENGKKKENTVKWSNE